MLLNNVFKSPEIPIASAKAYRFIPDSVTEALLRPFAMTGTDNMITAELSSPDVRYALLLVVFLGVFTMMPGVDKMAFLSYVPVVNVCLALRKLFSQQFSWAEYLVAFTMTVGLAAVMTLVSTRLLNREKALFNA